MHDIAKTMRQMAFDGVGGPEVLVARDAAVPQPGPGQVLVEVVAAGVNRPDCLQRQGAYPPPPGESHIPGLEIAGRIVALGAGVTGWRLGAEVCALVGSGGYAEYCVAAAELCLPRPRALTLIEAAGLPENYFTVFDNVFTRGKLARGETVLIHGGSSGIGSTAIQMAHQAGATVIATAGSAEKCDFCRSLGADHAIDYRAADFVAEVRRITGKRGVDVILDIVGGDYITRNISVLAFEGRLVQIAFLDSSKVAAFDFMPLMLRRLTITGSTLRPRSTALKAEIAASLREKIWPMLEDGRIAPRIDATFPLEQAGTAHALMETSTHMGKILLLTRHAA